MPLGVISAIYLTEYARQGRIIRIIRIGINCPGGVFPRLSLGSSASGFFVVFLKFGSSILAGSLTLGFLIMPTIIGASEEALKAVPQTFREASLALGVSKWQTTLRVVLPTALPGILTGSILGIGRAAGVKRRLSCLPQPLFLPPNCPVPFLTKLWPCLIIFTYWRQPERISRKRGRCSTARCLFWWRLFWALIL